MALDREACHTAEAVELRIAAVAAWARASGAYEQNRPTAPPDGAEPGTKRHMTKPLADRA